MEDQMAVVPVNGHEEPGLDQVDHQLLLLAAGMARDVDVQQFVVVDVSSQAEEVVQGMIDQLLVAWYGSGRDDDRVAGADADGLVFVAGHAHQG